MTLGVRVARELRQPTTSSHCDTTCNTELTDTLMYLRIRKTGCKDPTSLGVNDARYRKQRTTTSSLRVPLCERIINLSCEIFFVKIAEVNSLRVSEVIRSTFGSVLGLGQ